MQPHEMANLTVYLDMDGVLADFDRFVLEKTGRLFGSYEHSQDAWNSINSHKDIYMHLEPMSDAQELVNGVFKLKEVYGFRVGVLTAIPKIGRIPDAKHHKIYWILKHFPELSRNFNIGPHAEHKQYHCRVGDVLIDDAERNIPQWNSKDGFGILHKTAEKSLEELNRYLYRTMKDEFAL